jgi:hypothetical protein
VQRSSSTTALATIVREIVGKLISSIPDYIIKGMTAFVRWYFHLGMIGMVLATCCIAIAVILIGPILGLPSSVQDQIRGFLEPALVLLFLAAIFLGMIRGGKHS